jgi:hypothetical protein
MLFPVEKLDAFKEHIVAKAIEFTETSTKNVAKLFVTSKHSELTFSSYIENFQEYVNIQGAEYKKSERKFLIPLEKEDNLCKMLLDHKYSVLRRDENFKRKTADSTKEIVIDSDDEDVKNKQKKLTIIETDEE